eukprot:772494-Prorocentrum_minimum.AAC.1
MDRQFIENEQGFVVLWSILFVNFTSSSKFQSSNRNGLHRTVSASPLLMTFSELYLLEHPS